jgi:hypothetical protein
MSGSIHATRVTRCAAALVLTCAVVLINGCASSGGADVHGSIYMGVGYSDPWYWGPGYVPPPAYIGPPPAHRPPRPAHPIAPPPRPPAAPRPSPRR